MGLITVIIATFIISVLGGGIGYLIYLKTRPKKITWRAKCYQVGAGIREIETDSKGNPINKLKLKDLKPYTTDLLERIEKRHGIVVYRLKKLNMTTNAVTADMVEVWSMKNKSVDVLIEGSTAVVLTKGYDTESANKIFKPMPRERIELIKSEISIKKDRLKKEKDILQAITPWIVAGIMALSLVAMFYVGSEAYVKSSENIQEAQHYAADKMTESAEIYKQALEDSVGVVNSNIISDPNLNKQPPKPIESIE